jgi:hypothetical protein
MAKILNSSANRSSPGTGIGAEPDRLGSIGTANMPHTIAAISVFLSDSVLLMNIALQKGRASVTVVQM